MDEVNAGPTALDGPPTLLHFTRTEIAPRRTNRSTNAERAIMMMVLTFILWFLLPKFAVIGRPPELPIGPLPDKNPYGGVYSVSVNPSNARQFVVGIDGLSQSDCEYLVTKAWTDSVGYIASNHTESGATGNCRNTGANNSVQIIFGD